MENKRKVGRPPKSGKAMPKSSLVMTDEEYKLATMARNKYNNDAGLDLSKTKFFAMCVIDRSMEILGENNVKEEIK